MKKITISEIFKSDIVKVFDKVTSNESFIWRTDIQHIEVINKNTFIEISKDGYRTEFTITSKRINEYYAFTIKNKNLKGCWSGSFIQEGKKTQIVFTEEVAPNNPIMYLFIGSYIKKQQATYIRDLKIAFGE